VVDGVDDLLGEAERECEYVPVNVQEHERENVELMLPVKESDGVPDWVVETERDEEGDEHDAVTVGDGDIVCVLDCD
jgi:hypothetical protein